MKRILTNLNNDVVWKYRLYTESMVYYTDTKFTGCKGGFWTLDRIWEDCS